MSPIQTLSTECAGGSSDTHTQASFIRDVSDSHSLFFPAFSLCRDVRTQTDCCGLNCRQRPRAEEKANKVSQDKRMRRGGMRTGVGDVTARSD